MLKCKLMSTPFLGWLLVAHAVTAEEEDILKVYGDERMVSIATGYPETLSQAPATTTLITAEDIQEIGAATLDGSRDGSRIAYVDCSGGNVLPHHPGNILRNVWGRARDDQWDPSGASVNRHKQFFPGYPC